ncbi:MAG: hypothetical protein CM15mP74_19310 [Halieaceae bacterium]|nr:MAG: hypothetical protein CM15mP74_19310 [Halieaceae bacterium]
MLAGSVITALRKVEPALNKVTLLRSIIDANRPAWGKSGEPSAITVDMPKANGCGDQIGLARNPARVPMT